MARLMCFRPTKKPQQNGDVYGVATKDVINNVAPNNRMSVLVDKDEELTLQYVTSKILVLSCGNGNLNQTYSELLRKHSQALKSKHSHNYKVWSVSRRRGDVSRLLAAEDCGWPAGLAPPLDRLCALCKQFEQWLLSNSQNVVVIHCKGDRSRAAIVVAALMHYNAICSSDDSVEDRFNMQRFSDKYIGGTGQPSHRRYITYFSSLLSGKVRVNPAPLYLLQISLSHLQGRLLAFKVYERLQPVYETNAQNSKELSKWNIEGELRLRGDILIKCLQDHAGQRSDFLLCQLNTCSLEVSARTASLTFHKEDLDLIFASPSVDNRVLLELVVSLDPPTTSTKGKSQLEDRSNSYQDFFTAEDESTSIVEYSEIRKGSKKEVAADTESKNCAITDSSENKANLKEEKTVVSKMPPPVPPKPRSSSAMADPIGEVPERRGVLPAQIRPVAHRPPSPRSGGRATPSIEPDLVGKDRYDKASKCFSYAPAKALNEAFERPRRSSFSRTIERAEDLVDHVNPADTANVPVYSQDNARMSETPKWDDQIERTKQEALLEELSRMPTRSHSVAAQPYYARNDQEIEEKPVIVDQAQRAVPTTTPTGTLNRNRTKYGSYRTLNDDKYSSVMDDLCDPDFYLNYKAPSAPQPPPRQAHAGAKSVELPRRRFQPVESFTDPLDDILNSSGVPPAASCLELRDENSFRSRNCRSVAAMPTRKYTEKRDSPYFRDRRIFSENYDATSDARDPDDWLTNKLRKVRSKRDLDPDLVRRRTQEKMLLEELKNANEEKEAHRQHLESESRNGGASPVSVDMLAEYRREEERLKNTYSPFQENGRRSRQVRGKPPTPPPRERSRSPGRSERATPSIDSNYASFRHQNGTNEPEDFDFSTLSSIVQPNSSHGARESRSLQRKPSFGNERVPFQYNERSDTPTRFYSGQERVAAAIYRAETPQKEMYASGTITRPETPNRYYPDNSTFSQRSATPAFPITRETPVPFHPLLYNQNSASRGDLDKSHTLNYRSSSPRSQYGHLSRRSSMNSVDTSEIIHHHPVFVKDTSKYWYKPNISREQAINMLRDKEPGTFVVRDSNSFPGAFGLALKVATPPPGVAIGDGTELVRHFLIEPSPKGVKLKGCNNEPVFGSLSALVYQHSITPLALPTRLILPEFDPASTAEHVSATQALLEQGAACNVAFIGSIDVESLTGNECIRRAIGRAAEDSQKGIIRPVSVHFKVSSQGVTLTDNTRKVFFRRHFPVNSVIYAGMDPSDRRFDNFCVIGYHDSCVSSARMFAFVARKPSSAENACHVFAELEPEQPASAVVNFINKVMLASKR